MKHRTQKFLAGAAIWLSLAGFTAEAKPVGADNYPNLGDKQLGHINRIVQLSRQADGDWSSMGVSDPDQFGYDSYRFQLAFMSYALTVANYRYTPAYREIYRDTDLRLIQKMLRPDVWNYWRIVSQSEGEGTNKKLTEVPLFEDPVADENIMYSGHLLQMVATYRVLYGDDRFTKPGAISFSQFGKVEASYDTGSLAKVVFDQFKASGWKGVACEPNDIFVECNGHPIMGFAHYDAVTGTNYYPQAREGFKRQIQALGYIDPKTQSYMHFYKIPEAKPVYSDPVHADNDAWAGLTVHGWAKDEAEKVYAPQKDRHLLRLPDGTATVKTTVKSLDPDALYGGYSLDHNFFAAYAIEVGDTNTRDQLIAYAEKNWNPKWEGDQYYYSRNDNFKNAGDGPNVWRKVSALSANGLVPFAELDTKDGLYDLYNKPLPATFFQDPYISDVPFPAVQISRAIYDGNARALIVTMRPGREAGFGTAAWTVRNLNSASTYNVWSDGKKMAVINGAAVKKFSGSDMEFSVTSDGAIAVSSPLRGERTFIIEQE